MVRELRQRLLFGVLRGRGPQPAALNAAELGLAYLRAADLTMGVVALVRGLHSALEGTTGAEATLGLISGDYLVAVRVGGSAAVELWRTGGSELTLPPSPGLLGRALARPRVETARLAAGQRLAMLSGELLGPAVMPLLQPAHLTGQDAAATCQAVVERGWRGDHEAAVLVLDLG
jgi:hypothetical protein